MTLEWKIPYMIYRKREKVACKKLYGMVKREKNTMFPSYRIAMAPFQFSYRIGLLFPLGNIFFSMIFATEGVWNAPILEVIRGVAINRIAIDPLGKANGNTTGTIIGYDFEFK